MRSEKNIHSNKLRVMIAWLQDILSEKDWRQAATVLADVIAEIKRLEERNKELATEVEYWQRKSGS